MKRTICIVLAVLLSAASWADEHLRLSTVVIDPGHGGKDPGAVSRDKKVYEKTYALSISLALAEKIRAAYPDVKVVLTRSDDKYVTVGGRADIANKEEADLFISVHHNAVSSASPNGFSVHVLGQSRKKGTDLYANNMDIVRRENAVILLEEDYSTTYGDFDPNDPESYIFMNLMQNANLEQSVRFAQLVEKNLKGGPIKNDRGLSQDPFLVLWRTAMPAVLLELGFLSNDSDLKVLKSAEERDKLAECVFQAFKEYKEIYEGTVTTAAAPAVQPETPKQEAPKQAAPKQDAPKQETKKETKQAPKAETVYAVQIFAVAKKMDPKAREFMGYTPKVIKGEKLYKYYIGVSDSSSGARKHLSAIRKKYPDAFLVKIIGDEVTRVN